MAPRKKSSPRELPKRAVAKRKEKEVPARSSADVRKDLDAKMNLNPSVSAASLIGMNRVDLPP